MKHIVTILLFKESWGSPAIVINARKLQDTIRL